MLLPIHVSRGASANVRVHVRQSSLVKTTGLLLFCWFGFAEACVSQTDALTAVHYDQIHAAILAEVSAEPDRGTLRDHLGDL